ncbi:hypothetical protein ACFE04_012796 [Oxalis oulophora]
MNNEYRSDDNSYCYFHPTEVVVGVCPFCLNEKLLVLAHNHHHHHHKYTTTTSTSHANKSYNINKKAPHLPKIFAFGGSLLNRLELKQYWKSDQSNYSDHHHHHDSSVSQEDSFISIKFEDNGAASWEKATVSKSKVSLDHCSVSSWKIKDQVNNNIVINKEKTKTMVIEHAKPHSVLRWRKRIGHLFHVTKWKKSSKANTCHVGTKVEGVKVGHKGWIRTLTKRKSKESY